MYHLNSTLPAPYELNAPSPMMTALARGGKVKHRKVIAHFNPKELHILDHLQGHQERDHKTGLRSYSHLEELLKNPHIIGSIHRHTAHHHAQGGGAYLHHLREGGRHGDTELALIGPHTHHLFNQLAHGSTINPHTGHPEYWSLGGILGGIGSALKSGASTIGKGISSAAKSAAPMLSNLASGALKAGKAIAPHLGTLATTLGPVAAQMAMQKFMPQEQQSGEAQQPAQEQEFNPENMINMLPESFRGLGQAGLRAFNAYRGGASPQQAFGQGLSQFGGGFGGTLGNAMQGFGSALEKGQDIRAGLGQAAQRVGQGYGGRFGQALQGAGQAFGEGQDLGNSLSRGFQQGLRGRGKEYGMPYEYDQYEEPNYGY